MTRILAIMLMAAVACTTAPTTTAPAWEAMLQGTPSFPDVTGAATAETSLNTTTVTASISGATPGATHPWHIHYGTCQDDQGIVGAPDAYPHLAPGPNGEATAMATVGVVLQANQPYFVNVHASPQELETIVACGQLTPR